VSVALTAGEYRSVIVLVRATPTALNRQSPNIAHVITSTISAHMPHLVKIALQGLLLPI